MTISEFNLYCRNKNSKPTCLTNDHDDNPLNLLLNHLRLLHKQVEHINLTRLQTLANINKALRANQLTSTPTPTDYANRSQDKSLTTIRQFRKHITTPLHIIANNQPINSLPQSKTIIELIIKWNLCHNTHNTKLNSLWTHELSTLACTDILDILKNPPRKSKLPDRIPEALNSIFHIEAQLFSDPINSHFSTFTSSDPRHKSFGGHLTIPEGYKTFYYEKLDNSYSNLSTLLQIAREIDTLPYEQNILFASTLPIGWESTPQALLLKNHKRIHKIAHFAPNTIRTYSTDDRGYTYKARKPLSTILTIWLIHSPRTSLDMDTTRNNYFTHLKRLKKEHRSLRYHL